MRALVSAATCLFLTTAVLPLRAEDTVGYTRGEKVSYSIGYDLGKKMAAELENLDLKRFQAGLQDAYYQHEPKLSLDEMDFIVGEFGREVARKARDQRERISARNRERSRTFLAKNATAEGVTVTPSGLQYRVLKAGRGSRPRLGSRVRVHHRATFLDGTEFESTYSTQPAEFVLAEGVLPGYREALERMSEGAHWLLFVPPHLAYGASGQPSNRPGRPAIEPNATLIFDVELLDVMEKSGE